MKAKGESMTWIHIGRRGVEATKRRGLRDIRETSGDKSLIQDLQVMKGRAWGQESVEISGASESAVVLPI